MIGRNRDSWRTNRLLGCFGVHVCPPVVRRKSAVGRGGGGLWRGGPDGGGHAWAVLWRCLGERGVGADGRMVQARGARGRSQALILWRRLNPQSWSRNPRFRCLVGLVGFLLELPPPALLVPKPCPFAFWGHSIFPRGCAQQRLPGHRLASRSSSSPPPQILSKRHARRQRPSAPLPTPLPREACPGSPPSRVHVESADSLKA